MSFKEILIHVFNFLYYILLMQLILGILNLLPNISYSNRIRGFLVKPFFKKCGKNFQLAKGAIINMPRNIQIGDNVYLAHNIWLNGAGGLTIGNDVVISPNVVISTSKHDYINGKVSLNSSTLSPVQIGDGSWIASNTTVSQGTSIGKGSIIGASSAVTKDIEDYVFAAGTPAKKIRQLQN
ncbi:acyltransferase [Aerococcus urinaeequi]|uniref:acyltransferase n=1 Tax=Aerococcus urinaeequi TaxID=51665 RepID=UPI003B3BB8BA